MSARLFVASLGLTVLAAAAACQSSGRYGAPKYAAASAGVGAIGAVASRAAGGCYAQCIAGTHCNRATGLCEAGEAHPGVSVPPKARGGRPTVSASASYEPGHEYEVPPLSADDAGCAPAAVEHADGGIACELDAATATSF